MRGYENAVKSQKYLHVQYLLNRYPSNLMAHA